MPLSISAETQSRILELRERGLSYQKIADLLNLNKKTVAGYCNPKNKEKARLAMQNYREANRDKVRATARKSHWANKEKCNHRSRNYYRQNRDELRKKAAAYRERNKIAIRQAYQQYYYNNQQRLIQYSREYRRRHPDSVKIARQRHYKAQKHRYIARNALRRARQFQATPFWLTEEQVNSMNLIYELRDALSRNTGMEYHVDHIVPLKAKNYFNGRYCHVACGLHVPWNLQVVPKTQNLKKNCSLKLI